MSDSQSLSFWTKVGAWIKQHPIAFVVIVLVFYGVGNSSINDARARQEVRTVPAVQAKAEQQVKGEKQVASESLQLGEDGYVSFTGSTTTRGLVMLATEKDHYMELLKSQQLGDDHAVLGLIAQGKVFPLREGSTVKKIDGNISLDKVRVLIVSDPEQKHLIGMAGWMAKEYTFKTK